MSKRNKTFTKKQKLVSPVLINISQVSQMLNCSKRHIYRMVDSGKMPRPVRLGSLVLWIRTKVEEWVENGCKPIERR